MSLPDEDREHKLKASSAFEHVCGFSRRPVLQGFKFCHWLERWRLACHVLTITHDVSFVQLSRPNELLLAQPDAQVTTPDDLVLTDRLAIYKCLAAAATTSAAWMSRLSDDDISWHIAMVDRFGLAFCTCRGGGGRLTGSPFRLGDAVEAMLAANTRVQYESARSDVEEALAMLDKNSDLSRFVRKYRKVPTHFLRAG
jgi:hypothetical protein